MSDYSVIDQVSVANEGGLLDGLRQSSDEVPIKHLSGDEAIEKSSMTFSGSSSIWAKRDSKASFLLTSVTVMKSMVGVGILGVPNVMRNLGIACTTLIMFSIYGLGLFVSNLMLKNKNLSRRSNYSTIGYEIFKKRWIIQIINIIIILSNLGTCLSELIIFGDTTQLLIKYFKDQQDEDQLGWYFKRSIWIIAIGIILFPLLIVKSIEKLRFVSLAAILSITFFSVLVIYNFTQRDAEPQGFSFLIPEDMNWKSTMTCLPTLLIAYNWQFNLFPIYKGMKNTGDKKFFFSYTLGYSMATMLYLTVGILGYATYGSAIETNYLKTIQPDMVGGALYVILNMTFVISTTLTMPILFFGARNNFIQLVKSITSNKAKVVEGYRSSTQKKEDMVEVRLRKRKDSIRFYCLTILLFALIELGAIFLDNLELVFNLKGAIFSNSIQFVLPCLFYIMLCRKVKRLKFKDNRKQMLYYWVIVLFGLSWVFMFTCVASGILKQIDKK